VLKLLTLPSRTALTTALAAWNRYIMNLQAHIDAGDLQALQRALNRSGIEETHFREAVMRAKTIEVVREGEQ